MMTEEEKLEVLQYEWEIEQMRKADFQENIKVWEMLDEFEKTRLIRDGIDLERDYLPDILRYSNDW